jgi:hypothetical protein
MEGETESQEVCMSFFMSYKSEESRGSGSGPLLLVLVTNPFQKFLLGDMTFKSDSWRSVPL